jgi:hypothetical protein
MEPMRRIFRSHCLQKIADVRADAEIANSPDVKRNFHLVGLWHYAGAPALTSRRQL